MTRELSAQITRAIEGAGADELPALVGQLEEAHALAWARLTQEAARPPAVRLLTVVEASELARRPRRRVFAWSHRSPPPPWAVRVGRRLLVEETAFRKWLLDSARDRSGKG